MTEPKNDQGMHSVREWNLEIPVINITHPAFARAACR